MPEHGERHSPALAVSAGVDPSLFAGEVAVLKRSRPGRSGDGPARGHLLVRAAGGSRCSERLVGVELRRLPIRHELLTPGLLDLQSIRAPQLVDAAGLKSPPHQVSAYFGERDRQPRREVQRLLASGPAANESAPQVRCGE